jgi:DNA helicase-2/ATP-dependent DNA helicase PcrA
MAFSSFTNAACDEARSRLCKTLGLYDYEVPYCGTIHSLAKRALGIGTDGRDWLAAGKKLKEFGDSYDYDLMPAKKAAAEDMDEIQKQGGQDAILATIWEVGRNRLKTTAAGAWDAFDAYDPDTLQRVERPRFLQFVEEYEEWKHVAGGYNRLYDFTDLLQAVLDAPERAALPVSCAVIDEAQDMTPLLWRAADILFDYAEHRACLGDDDQAIFGYQGASPELFNSRAAERVVLLHQSRRLPRAVLELAQRVIQQNRDRVAKDFRPVTLDIVRERHPDDATFCPKRELDGHVGRVRGLRELDLLNGESWFVLVRNWAHVPAMVNELETAGIPYAVGGGQYYSPWAEKGPLRAVRTLYALSDGDQVTLSALGALMDRSSTATKDRPGAWAYGQKVRIQERIDTTPDEKVGLADLPHLGLTEWGFDRIVTRDLEILRGGISDRDLTAYSAAQDRGTWMQEPRVLVSTIHGVKGQEADNVAALMTCTGAPQKNLNRPDRREEEIRLAYVAITRARKAFYGVEGMGQGYPYEIFGV